MVNTWFYGLTVIQLRIKLDNDRNLAVLMNSLNAVVNMEIMDLISNSSVVIHFVVPS